MQGGFNGNNDDDLSISADSDNSKDVDLSSVAEIDNYRAWLEKKKARLKNDQEEEKNALKSWEEYKKKHTSATKESYEKWRDGKEENIDINYFFKIQKID